MVSEIEECSMTYRQSEMYNRAKYLKTYHYSLFFIQGEFSPLSYLMLSSVVMFSHCMLHMSVHCRPASCSSTCQPCKIFCTYSSSKISCSASFNPNYTNVTVLKLLSTSQSCPCGEAIIGSGTIARLQIAA